ncbi:MAG: glycoside hydrolase family 9 protein [Candidatus Marinimicrobia bacterium]|nr:glycoside hydrolase family 9 protein [Candidatus Neomarinimicrobiota bacterium]MCF7839714.1 glycoside hydrolase family 9 protein [Candidatus Neomarinimicrobiota bacterium]
MVKQWKYLKYAFVAAVVSTSLWHCAVARTDSSTEIKYHIRMNQLGFLPGDLKTAIVLTRENVSTLTYHVVLYPADKSESVVVYTSQSASLNKVYGKFQNTFELDFSQITEPGEYQILLPEYGIHSHRFRIGPDIYPTDALIGYISQQRCGYNPFLDTLCHQYDGRTMYGPMPDSTYIDVRGGWHDAGDYLRYMLTSGNTIARLLFTYRENPENWPDEKNALGRPEPNGIPDILDEAKWGLDWMLKMHPEPDQLFHQVADDRDHMHWDLPQYDQSDYGWGPGSSRVVYYATGKPQGFLEYQNTSTGIANLAGRYAAIMAMAADIWENDLETDTFAEQCLTAGKEVYAMGLAQPGCQEGTPCRAPYRYYESSWHDDMEWGAAELYRITGKKDYLRDAKRFAIEAGVTEWMGQDTARHYEYYPFMNLGHYSLAQVIDNPAFRDTLINFYREGLARVKVRAKLLDSPFGYGIPFIWCSNNLASALVNQGLLYEKMSGDQSFRPLVTNTRDWLLGRNPWGVSQFVGVGVVTPKDPHSVIADITGREITGGMNDGPVYGSIYGQLKGIALRDPDEYAPFQSDYVVFHDDLGDYSTNEPTLDGTAEAVVFFGLSR